MQTTTCVLIGNQVGRGDVLMAMKACKEAAIISGMLFALLMYVTYVNFIDIINFFTDIELVQAMTYEMRLYLIFNIPLDAFAC